MALKLDEQINTISSYRFMNCLSHIGKTEGMILNVTNFIDDALMIKSEFEVLVICASVDEKKYLESRLSDYYKKYTTFKTMYDVLYLVSSYPVLDNNPYDIPHLSNLIQGRHYEKIFVDPSCYEVLLKQQLEKLKAIGDLL